MFTNREIATAMWLSVLAIFSLTRSEVRSALTSLARSFFVPKIVVPFLVFATWLAIWIWLAGEVGLWQSQLLKDTIIWFLVSGIALLMSVNHAAEDERFFKNTTRSTVEIGVAFSFFLNIISFGLIAELFIQPIIALFAVSIVFAGSDKETERVKPILEVMLSSIVLVLVILTVANILRNHEELDLELLLRSFALSIWLPIVTLPFIFVFGLICCYEVAFLHMELGNGRRPARLRNRLALIVGLNFRLHAIHDFVLPWPGRVAAAPSFRSALQVVREFLEDRAQTALKLEIEQARLKRFAGIEGVDEDGRRLDHREFEATQEALRWLATCQMGWYRNHGGQYRLELLEQLEVLAPKGLPEVHEISLEVSADGQAWYAWRRTVSDWVFAIGASKGPPDQWTYDGPEPPKGFPGDDPMWGSSPFAISPNWQP